MNDTIGHQKGDDVLRAVSTVLRGCSRESDYLARYGEKRTRPDALVPGTQRVISVRMDYGGDDAEAWRTLSVLIWRGSTAISKASLPKRPRALYR